MAIGKTPPIPNLFTGTQTEMQRTAHGSRITTDNRTQSPERSLDSRISINRTRSLERMVDGLAKSVHVAVGDLHHTSRAASLCDASSDDISPIDMPAVPNFQAASLRSSSIYSWEDEKDAQQFSQSGKPGRPNPRVRFSIPEYPVTPIQPGVRERGSIVSDLSPLNSQPVQSQRSPHFISSRDTPSECTPKSYDPRKPSEVTLFPTVSYSPIKPIQKKSAKNQPKIVKLPHNARSHGRSPRDQRLSPRIHPDARKDRSSEEGGCFVSWYHRALAIYKAGPPGEGQQVWQGYKRHQMKGNARKQAKRQRKQLNQTGKPKSRGHKDGLFPNVPLGGRDSRPASGKLGQFSSKHEGSIESSPRSLEAMLGASMSVQYDAELDTQARYIDTSKPLPPIPLLEPAPKSRKRRQNQLPKSPPAPRVPPESDRRVGDLSPLLPPLERPFVTLKGLERPFISLRDNSTTRDNEAARKPSWLSRVRAPSSAHENLVAGKHIQSHQSNLKSKISAPIPIQSTQPQYANTNAGNERVEQVANKRPLLHKGPSSGPQPPDHTGSKASHGWRELVHRGEEYAHTGMLFNVHAKHDKPKRRRSSDESFACQGLQGIPEEPKQYPPIHSSRSGNQNRVQCEQYLPREAYTQSPVPGPSNWHKPRHEVENTPLIPAPMFSGRDKNSEARGAGKDRPKKRDTRFYQPYDDFLHEYQD